MALFLATYQGIDPGTLTMAVYDKLLESIGPVKAMQNQEYNDEMVRKLNLAHVNRREILQIWYKGIFPQPRLSDG